MAKLRVHNFAISLDGFGAGPDQSVEDPLGVGGEALHRWMFRTVVGQELQGQEVTAEPGLGDEYMRAGVEGIGATVMGRNMFGPVRGEWTDGSWRGWWGDDPPYHHDVFVLTHHPREPVEMEGGTTFHFVTDGPEEALALAFNAAGGQDVRLGGGVATVQEYLRLGMVDELHVVIAPVFLGGGERLFDPSLHEALALYEVVEQVSADSVTHVRLAQR